MSTAITDVSSLPPPPPLPPALPQRRGHPLIAWFVIILLVTIVVGYQLLAPRLWPREDQDRGYLSELQLQGRYLVGVSSQFGQSQGSLYKQADQELNRGPYEQRLRFVILAGELSGPAAALEELETMRKTWWEQHPPTDKERKQAALLEQLYRDYDRGDWEATSLTDEERAEIKTQFDWFGKLALAPQKGSDTAARDAILASARRTTNVLLTVAIVGLMLAGLGFLLLLAGIVGLFVPLRAGSAREEYRSARPQELPKTSVQVPTSVPSSASVHRGQIEPVAEPYPSDFPGGRPGNFSLPRQPLLRARFLSGSRDGGIYAETFALWMGLFMLLQLPLVVAARYDLFGNSRLLVAGLLSLSSVVVLAWPVLRGVTWRRVRQDLGLWTAGSPVKELFWGVTCYIAALPLVFLGLLVSGLMLTMYKVWVGPDPFGVPPRSSHPIAEVLTRANWWGILQIFIVAAVCAPIIEEIMFRGVLYRHMRELGSRWPRVFSVGVSALVVSFVFAVIHPQGFLGVPMLMALALGFTMNRELRGSLVGSIVAHGLNNGIVTVVAITMN